MGKRIKSEKKRGGGGKESKFIEEYTPLKMISLSIINYLDNLKKILWSQNFL
jgi:hypothetical protein